MVESMLASLTSSKNGQDGIKNDISRSGELEEKPLQVSSHLFLNGSVVVSLSSFFSLSPSC